MSGGGGSGDEEQLPNLSAYVGLEKIYIAILGSIYGAVTMTMLIKATSRCCSPF